MTPNEARAHYNFLLTLCIRKAETFGPLAFTFLKEHNPNALGLLPEEQFNLLVATAEAFADEPKRYTHKLDCLQKALDILPATSFFDPGLARQIHQDIQRLKAELDLYSAAMKPERQAAATATEPQRIIVETDMPDYFLSIGQQRAAAYYQEKYRLTKESKIAQHFTSATRKFEPQTTAVHKEFPGACAPFVAARTGAWHVMLPFDLKISRSPEDPLDAALRIWYAKLG
ncbi:MAG TPA: hypothetical protein VFM24_09360, partial [Nitrospira sp.]|nr:hypothetical protein [Nitrospira sp.]